MARFRQNHVKSDRSSGFLARGLIFSGVLIGIMFLLFYKMKDQIVPPQSNKSKSDRYDINYDPNALEDHSELYEPVESRTYLPEVKGDLIHHTYYTLDYNEDTEQSNWVSYRLTKKSLEIPNVPRAKKFRYDQDISTRSANHSDYTHSGYTRGHMAPAGDMAFNEVAMNESFLMSNMSPQTRGCNGGIWKELEENVRDWAFSNGSLIVVSGPIFYNRNPKRIGKKTKVAIPDAFYKIVLDNEGRDKKSIAFIIPNDTSDEPLSNYAVTIDKVEDVTDINFFENYFDSQDVEDKMEGNYNLKSWKISDKRYKQRVKSWNKG